MIVLKTLDLVVGAIVARLLKWMALAGLRPNMNRVTPNIWVAGINHPDLVASEGFDAVLDLRSRDDSEYRKRLEECGVDYLNIKIPDGHGAPPDILLRIVEWLIDRTEKGDKVLVHCNLGRGRAALAASAYLVHVGETPNAAIKTIKEKRRVTFLNAQQSSALEKFSDTISPRGELPDTGKSTEVRGEGTSDLASFFNKGNLIRFVLSFGLSLAILYYVFFEFINIEEFLETIRYLSLPLLIASDIPYMVQTVLYSYRLKLGLGSAGVEVPYGRAYWSHLFGMFWSNFALGKLGYYAAALPLRRQVRVSESTGVISAIQTLDLAVKGAAAVLGLIAISQVVELQEVRIWALSMSVGFIVLGSTFLALVWRERLPFNLEVSRIPFVGGFLQSFKDSGFMVKGVAPRIVMVAIIGWFLRGVEWYALSHACGIGFPFALCFFLHPLLTMIRMIPVTFSGLGVLEFTLIKLFPSILPEKLVLFGMLDMVNNVFVDVFALKEIRSF